MVLTAVDLTRVVGVVGLGPVRGQDLDRVLGLVSVPAMVPTTGRVLDRRAAQLPLLHPVIIRLNRSSPRLIFENISRRGLERTADPSTASPTASRGRRDRPASLGVCDLFIFRCSLRPESSQ